MVIKYSQDRRREIEEFIGALNRRIDAEETYAKSVEEAAKVAEKIRQGEERLILCYSASLHWPSPLSNSTALTEEGSLEYSPNP